MIGVGAQGADKRFWQTATAPAHQPRSTPGDDDHDRHLTEERVCGTDDHDLRHVRVTAEDCIDAHRAHSVAADLEATAALPPIVGATAHRWAPDEPDAEPAGCLYEIGYRRPALPGSELDMTCRRPEVTTVACCIANGCGQELTRVLISRMTDR